ncbi:MAG TPA: thioredoxin [Solirubrobacterales bacterium]
MPVAVNEESFDAEVLQRSQQVPVVVDFWADWCGPCKALSPALEKAEAAREGKIVLAKVDVDANPQLAAIFKVQGIPAVKAFRDGEVVDEFVGALPPARVEAFFDSLVPSRADELFAAGDELSLREAAEAEPGRADIAVALAKARLERGAEDEALEAVAGHDADFAAAGIAARVRLAKLGIGSDGFAALDRGDREAALDALLEELRQTQGDNWSAGGLSADDLRDLLRRAVVGILADLEPGDPVAREYRRRLSTAL